MSNLPHGDLSKAGLYFNFAFYGAGRDEATGQFKSSKQINTMMPTYAEEILVRSGPSFKRRLGERFNAKHGRTGATARSMEEDMRRRGDAFIYSVRVHGGVGFVINPIATHLIPRDAASVQYAVAFGHPLYNPMEGPFTGRTENRYSPFGAVKPQWWVEWRQGGDESYSPDTSWYDADAQLYADTYEEFAAVSSRIAMIWGGAPKEYLNLPIKSPYYNPYNPNADN